MDNQLVRYAGGQETVPVRDRRVSRQAKRIYDRTRLTAMEVDAQYAIAGYAMKGFAELDAHRKQLAGDDVALNMALAEIMQQAIFGVQTLQKRLVSDWGFG